MNIAVASQHQINLFLDEFSAWSVENGKLHREFIFNDFVDAFGFMTKAAIIAEKLTITLSGLTSIKRSLWN